MKLHRHTSLERIRGWPPSQQIGMVAAELLRAARLLDHDGRTEALTCLARARELLGAAEVSPNMPVAWTSVLLRTVRTISQPGFPAGAGPAVRRLHDDLMELCGAELERR